MLRRLALAAALPLALTVLAAQSPKPKTVETGAHSPAPATVNDFLKANCLSCHNAQTKQGNLDLTSLPFDLTNAQTFARWVKVHDRVRDGEMPPKGMPKPPADTQAAFLKALANPMIAADKTRARTDGRALW